MDKLSTSARISIFASAIYALSHALLIPLISAREAIPELNIGFNVLLLIVVVIVDLRYILSPRRKVIGTTIAWAIILLLSVFTMISSETQFVGRIICCVMGIVAVGKLILISLLHREIKIA